MSWNRDLLDLGGHFKGGGRIAHLICFGSQSPHGFSGDSGPLAVRQEPVFHGLIRLGDSVFS